MAEKVRLILPDITHAIVTTATKENSDKYKILATVRLCFGPGDDNAITCIQVLRGGANRGFAIQLPHSSFRGMGAKPGDFQTYPVFTGELGRELSRRATAAITQIKKDCVFKWDRKYRVTATKATELSDASTTPVAKSEANAK